MDLKKWSMYLEMFVVAPLMPATTGLTVMGFLCILYGKYIYWIRWFHELIFIFIYVSCGV